jgi:hypothetical protein
MAFFAFERRDSKLLVFSAFVLALAAYIWWSRRARQARLEAMRESAMASEEMAVMQQLAAAREGGRAGRRAGLELVDLEELQSIMLEARRQAELQGAGQEESADRGLSPRSKANLRRFAFRADSFRGAGAEAGEEGSEEEGRAREEGRGEGEKAQGGRRREGGREGGREDGSGSWGEGSGRGGRESALEGGGEEVGEEGEEKGGMEGGEEGGEECLKRARVDRHCSICLGDYEEGETLCLLPCRHTYHDDCLNVWISAHAKCPLCNYDLLLAQATAASMASHAASPLPGGDLVGGGGAGDEEEAQLEEEALARENMMMPWPWRQGERRWGGGRGREGGRWGRGEPRGGEGNVVRIVRMEA